MPNPGFEPAPAKQPGGLSLVAPLFPEQLAPVIPTEYTERRRLKLDHYIEPLPPLYVRDFCVGEVDRACTHGRQEKREIVYLRWEEAGLVWQIYFHKKDHANLERFVQSGNNPRTIIQMNHATADGEKILEKEYTQGRKVVFVKTETHFGKKARHWMFESEYQAYLQASWGWYCDQIVNVVCAPMYRVTNAGNALWFGNNLSSSNLQSILARAGEEDRDKLRSH